MPDGQTLLLFMGAALPLNVAPGPNMLYVAARSATDGRAAGVAATLGVTTGGLLHTLGAAVGLSGLLATVPGAYDAVRFAGAAYLIVLGVRALRARRAPDAPPLPPTTRGAAYRQGVVTNVLNPKVGLFFLALLPQFADPARGPIWLQMVVLGVLFNTSGTAVNLSVAIVTSGAGAAARRWARGATWLHRLSGAVFVGLGLRLALSGRR